MVKALLNYDIDKLIPHRDRMKLIEGILELNEQKVVTLSIVNEKWPLVCDNAVNPIILIEIVAQTTGIAVGNKKLKETGKGAFGYLVGIKNAEFYIDKIPLGNRLECTVNLLYDLKSYGVFTGTVNSGNKIQGKVEIQVFSPGD